MNITLGILIIVFVAWFAIYYGAPSDRYGDRINFAWFWQRTQHFFGVWTGGDDNFAANRRAVTALEDSLDMSGEVDFGDPVADARIVEEVEAKVVGPAIRNWTEAGELARDAVWESADHLLGVDAAEAAFRLRLWDGCLTAAKCIALSTRSGRNWPWWRKRFARNIEKLCANDPVFERGVRAAVAFKEGRGEPWSFFGVPEDSVVREGALGK